MILKRFLVLLVAAVLAAGPAVATVNSQVSKTIALGNGSQTQFAFGFIGVAAQYIAVTFTDASGNATLLTQGAGATQYQIVLNPAVTGAIWGLGGTVTYNPNGSAIPAGTTLTIARTLPLTQAISLQNQPSVGVLGTGAETASDTLEMQLQQVLEAAARAIQANPTNSAAPLPLPPAAQLANMGLCADATGNNIVGCTLPATGVISTAMQGVVNAATLALGRTAFGLGTLAVENLGGTCGGASIQDDGSAGGANGVGFARVVLATVSDATNQNVTCAFHLQQRIATGPLTYTLPRANTLFNGFGFWVVDVAGTITVTPNANDNFAGYASGSALIIPAGTWFISTNAASSGTWLARSATMTTSYLTSGSSATYTTPVGARELRIRMIGGGGGGGAIQGTAGGGGTPSVITGVAGAAGGNGGGANSGASPGDGGAGGTGGSGSASLRIAGGSGGAGSLGVESTAGGNPAYGPGGNGCSSPFGGGGAYTNGAGHGDAPTNSGAGGSGSPSNNSGAAASGGGGCGEYVEVTIFNPASGYTYTVGPGGAGGTGGAAGGHGGSGLIIVQELYNFLLRRDIDPASNDNAPMWLAPAA